MNISKMTLDELRHFIDDSRKELTELATRSADLNGEDADRFDTLEADVKAATERKRQIEDRSARIASEVAGGDRQTEHGSTQGGTSFGTPPAARADRPKLKGRTVLGKEDRMEQWAVENGHAPAAGTDLTLSGIVRGIGVGNWSGVSTEDRALVEGTQSAGGVLVPTPVAAGLIDRARNQTAVLQAGASVVPMTSQTIRVPRLVGEGAPQFYAEGQQRVAQDISFDSIELKAKAFDRLILVSNELLEDSDPSASGIIEAVFAKQLALGLDQAALFGDGISPNPTGLFNTVGVPKVSHGTNGTAVTNYDWPLQAVGNVRGQNFTPTGIILSPRTATSFSLLKDGQGSYLAAPQGLPPTYVTGTVPNNYTVGSSTTASVIFTGDWSNLLVGIRKSFTLKVLPERWADTNQTGFLAQMRLDFAVAQPLSFQIDTGVL